MRSPDSVSALFQPVRLGELDLANRIVMAPLTRCRVGNAAAAPEATQARYYAQRAGAGLIVSEGTIVSPQGRGYPFTPGIWSAEQGAGWRLVTDAVHAAGGRIVCQLWHCGRLSLPEFHAGAAPVAPSAIDPHWKMFGSAGLTPTVTPRALSREEIAGIVADFARAAAIARDAGFDGVEIHASNGYLFHQFFARCSNIRDDDYGGSHANRARLLCEVLDAVSRELPLGRVGVRLNPMMHNFHGIVVDEDTVPFFDHLVRTVDSLGLAYLHLTEPYQPGQLDGLAQPLAEVAAHFRAFARTPILVNGGLTPARGAAMVAQGTADAAVFGRLFISNPDLPVRLQAGAPLADWDMDTFYQGGEKGYLDYPRWEAA